MARSVKKSPDEVSPLPVTLIDKGVYVLGFGVNGRWGLHASFCCQSADSASLMSLHAYFSIILLFLFCCYSFSEISVMLDNSCYSYDRVETRNQQYSYETEEVLNEMLRLEYADDSTLSQAISNKSVPVSFH